MNFDFSVSKHISIGESKTVEFLAAFYNVFNHFQFTPVSLGSVLAVNSNIMCNKLITEHPMFDWPDQVCNSHACEIGLVLRFIFQLSEEFRRLLVPEGYVRMSFTTLPSTSVRRKSRPWKRYFSLV